MLLVLDVGNTNMVLGIYQNEQLLHHWRVETSPRKTSDEYGIMMKALLGNAEIDIHRIKGIMLSSVVPPMIPTLERMFSKYFQKQPLIVGSNIETGLNVQLENSRELGADLIVNAVAGIHEYGTPLIIIDFGTATTYCYIDENGNYLGGAISPGITIATEALYTKAAKLPYIQLEMPKHVIGNNTVSAMQSGILFGYVGQVEGIVKRMKEQCQTNPMVVATGGLAALIASETDVIEVIDPFLTLKGLRLIYEKNFNQKED